MTILSSKTEMEAKPTFRIGCRERRGGVKSKRLYKREVREVGRRDLKGRGHKVGEKKRGES